MATSEVSHQGFPPSPPPVPPQSLALNDLGACLMALTLQPQQEKLGTGINSSGKNIWIIYMYTYIFLFIYYVYICIYIYMCKITF